ncbi:hypothetical protein Tco_0547020, partial [Tanacetum coccineum]
GTPSNRSIHKLSHSGHRPRWWPIQHHYPRPSSLRPLHPPFLPHPPLWLLPHLHRLL